MVTEQLGPRGKDADLRASFWEEQSVQSRHPSQLILYGPVVYADRLYDEFTRDGERTACRADSGCFCHQVGGNRPVTPRYTPEGWFLIKSQSGISSSSKIFYSNISLIISTLYKTTIYRVRIRLEIENLLI